MKVSLCGREHATRKYRKANQQNQAEPPMCFAIAARGKRIDAENWNDARVAQLRKSAALLQGWRPKAEKKIPAGLMLDAAMDQYLSEIKVERQKIYRAYDTALRYFFECSGNKPIKEIIRGDLIDDGFEPPNRVVGKSGVAAQRVRDCCDTAVATAVGEIRCVVSGIRYGKKDPAMGD
jgi:hypothetical protein